MLIQQNQSLLLASGIVTDLSGRKFKNITAFQYALWAMDYHMWTMIKQYLPKEAQAEQFNAIESKGTEHGKHYAIKPLADALQIYIDNAEKWSYGQRAQDHWSKKVGGAQKMVPAHVVNEYCQKDRQFDPCPKEWESKLPRTREIQMWNGSTHVVGSWFISPVSSNSLGYNFAFSRGIWGSVSGKVLTIWREVRGAVGNGTIDLLVLQSLWKARTEQLKLLSAELSVVSSQSQQSGFFQRLFG